MTDVHHFSYGLLTPSVAYVLSVLGSLLALTCTIRARRAVTNSNRAWWLVAAALALGGTGIWTMHFMAMLGFAVPGRPIRYDITATVLSAGIAVVAVGVGLFIVGFGRSHPVKLIAGGICTGLGVAGMHYTGMAGMHLDAEILYDKGLVGASIAIAVVASTVALWFAVTVTKPLVVFVCALVMGVAVTGMHYTGMAAMSVELREPSLAPQGATAFTLLLPIGLMVLLVILGLGYAMLAAQTDEDREAKAYLAKIAAAREAAMPAARDGGDGSGLLTGQRGTLRRTTVVPPVRAEQRKERF